tara:strand:+ start:1459 stop:1614 length:156 start_codon:yes stop_codon:yes gene_type:complete
MIIIKLLNVDNFYGLSKNIEIAKGKYKLPETIMQGINQIKRETLWRTKQAT